MSSLCTSSSSLILLLLALVCSTSAARCHIPREWSTKVVGRSDREVPAILSVPYCMLLSYAWVNSTSYHYALRVKDGSVAWHRPLAPLGDMTQAVQLLPVIVTRLCVRVGIMERDSMQANGSVCGVLAALQSNNGKVVWDYELCFPELAGVGPAFTVMQSPHSNTTADERIILAIGAAQSALVRITCSYTSSMAPLAAICRRPTCPTWWTGRFSRSVRTRKGISLSTR